MTLKTRRVLPQGTRIFMVAWSPQEPLICPIPPQGIRTSDLLRPLRSHQISSDLLRPPAKSVEIWRSEI